MDELKQIIKDAANAAGLAKLRMVKPENFELQVECALIDADVYEAQQMREVMSRIADTLGSQAQGRDGSNWRNVAFNLDPSTGNSGRVSRSYNRS